MTISDPYGRQVTNLRIAVTQRCNLHCIYCHKEGEDHPLDIEMTPNEIAQIITLAAGFGVEKIKITGGEPLIRNDIIEIVEETKQIAGIKEVSMTTNGVFLGSFAQDLKRVGLDRVNVSLDSVDSEVHRMITGAYIVEEVLQGIIEAGRSGLSPVKINMVVLKDVNDKQIWQMFEFARKNNAILQLIELESPVENDFYRKYHADLGLIEELLKRRAEQIIVRSMHHRKKYILHGGGEVEVVKPMHNTEFCDYCNRIRVTSDGKLKPCLMRSNNLIDLLSYMRQGASDQELKKLFVKAVALREPFFSRR